MKFYVRGKEYEPRLDTMKSCLVLSTDGKDVGDITRVGPTELQLIGGRGYYRVNAGSIEALASKHYQDTTGI